MIIFLYGPDTYRLNQHVRTLVERYTAKYPSGLNLLRMDGSLPENIGRIADALKSVSFFDEVKLLIVKNAFQKNTAEGLVQILKDQDVKSRKDIVVMFCEELDEKELKARSKELFSHLAGGTTLASFSLLPPTALHVWVGEEAERLGCSITGAATGELLRRTGPNTRSLALELQKLANYSGTRSITPADVALLVASPEDMNIFDLTDAVGGRNVARATALLYQQLAAGQDPYYILTMLTYHVRNLLALKDITQRNVPVSEGARRLGIHPFAARKSAEQARRFSFEELRVLFTQLAGIEQKTKQGSVHLQDELYRIVAS